MREITGELWDYYGRHHTIVLITTNGTVKKNGACVMGRGCAFEATQRIPRIAKQLGALIQKHGNVVVELEYERLWTFPVKHNWWERADLELIRRSAETLGQLAQPPHQDLTFVLPRPGCGNGHLTWEVVRPLLAGLPDNVLVITR